jgi:hypothetical protein
VHARDALGEQRAGTLYDELRPAIGVVVTGQGLGVRVRPRPLNEQPGRHPGTVSFDQTTGWIRRAGADAEDLEAV